ncbi:recombinase RecT [Sphingomonas sp.]|uniref:recombinase RecT n=1 Tax=Sphingomonas sp. TaxID=28214 RepID=UPI00307E6A23
MATQALARADNPYDQLRTQLESRAADFKMALPAHISPEKFQRTVRTAAQSNPDILKADRASLITACMKAAQDGLLPDGREAALVTFNTRKKDEQGRWSTVTLAQYMPMVFGLRKKILQSGEISSIETNVVYRREVEEGYFVFEAGTEAMLRHKPMLDLTDEDLHDDNIVAAYSVATMKDGTKSFEVMRRAEINKVRQVSQTGALGKKDRQGNDIPPKGPWVDWFAEMARKTVMRRHSKTLPMTGDLIDVEATDDAIYARSTAQVLASQEPDAPRVAPPTSSEIDHDPVTGEIPAEASGGEPDEETARELDRQAFAQQEGRIDDDPRQGEADAFIDRCEAAEVVGDVIAVEAELAQADLPEDLAQSVRSAANAARARLTQPGR